MEESIIVFAFDEVRMHEKLFELKTLLLSYSYPLAIIEKAVFNVKKEDIVIPFVATHYSNFDSKIVSNTVNSLLIIKDNYWKKYLQTCNYT